MLEILQEIFKDYRIESITQEAYDNEIIHPYITPLTIEMSVYHNKEVKPFLEKLREMGLVLDYCTTIEGKHYYGKDNALFLNISAIININHNLLQSVKTVNKFNL